MCSPPQTRTCPCRAELGSADVGLVVLCDCARVSHCVLDVIDTGWSLDFRTCPQIRSEHGLGVVFAIFFHNLLYVRSLPRGLQNPDTCTSSMDYPARPQHFPSARACAAPSECSCICRRQSQRQPAEASACQASSIACVSLRHTSSQSPHAVRPLVAGRSPRRRRQDHGRQRHLPRRR